LQEDAQFRASEERKLRWKQLIAFTWKIVVKPVCVCVFSVGMLLQIVSSMDIPA